MHITTSRLTGFILILTQIALFNSDKESNECSSRYIVQSRWSAL